MKTGDNRNLHKGRRKLRVIRFYTNRRRVLHPGVRFLLLHASDLSGRRLRRARLLRGVLPLLQFIVYTCYVVLL